MAGNARVRKYYMLVASCNKALKLPLELYTRWAALYRYQ